MTPVHPNPRGLFIVLEGIDGSGTTTQMEGLCRHLRARHRPVLPTREPSTGPIGVLLRQILLGQHALPDGGALDGRAMALMFAADRRDHLAREIEPALAAGTDVVSDRYVLSSLAYQAEEADRHWVERLQEGITLPDLTILIDISIDIAAERRRRAGRPIERYDSDRTLLRVAENYRRLASEGERWGNVVSVVGAGSIVEVEGLICNAVDEVINRVRLSS